MHRSVDLAHASRLLNHGPTVLVTSLDGNRRNVMAAAWSMPVEFTPPRVAVVIDRNTWTADLVAASGILGLCVPGRALARLTFAVGSESGRDLASAGTDKFTRHGLVPMPGPALGVPLVRECLACLECRVIVAPGPDGHDRNRHAREAYDTWFVEVVSASADERAFRDGRWRLDRSDPDLHTLHHLGAGVFAVAGEVVRADPSSPA